jgi:hypothetical protein
LVFAHRAGAAAIGGVRMITIAMAESMMKVVELKNIGLRLHLIGAICR